MKLIEDWKKAHKFLSVQFAAIGALICGAIVAFPEALTHAWGFVPEEFKTFIPERYRPLIAGAMFIGAILARLVKQPKLNCDEPASKPPEASS